MRKSSTDVTLSRTFTARRERILVTALKLIRGPSGVSVQMREVAEQADVALGTLYRYFPSRHELLAHAYERWREECVEILVSSNVMKGKTNTERFRELARRDFKFVEKEPNFCAIWRTLDRISNPKVVACMRRVRDKSYELYMQSIKGIERSDAVTIIDIFVAVVDQQANLFVSGRITSGSAYEALDRCIYMLLGRNPRGG
jgi:TetR/AcrR family transcriptional regulator, cholesterol catabolism regulator